MWTCLLCRTPSAGSRPAWRGAHVRMKQAAKTAPAWGKGSSHPLDLLPLGPLAGGAREGARPFQPLPSPTVLQIVLHRRGAGGTRKPATGLEHGFLWLLRQPQGRVIPDGWEQRSILVLCLFFLLYFPRAKSEKILPGDFYISDTDGRWGTSLTCGTRGQGHGVVI